MDILDRAGGAMLGLAIGEALGAPFEGLTHEPVQERAVMTRNREWFRRWLGQ